MRSSRSLNRSWPQEGNGDRSGGGPASPRVAPLGRPRCSGGGVGGGLRAERRQRGGGGVWGRDPVLLVLRGARLHRLRRLRGALGGHAQLPDRVAAGERGR